MNEQHFGFKVRQHLNLGLHEVKPETRTRLAEAREKAIKKWRRVWKLELIERGNPQWLDLYDRLNG